MSKSFVKLFFVSLIAIIFVAATPMSAKAAFTMHTATQTAGNQAYSSVGLEFDVNSSIRVLKLGVYDSAGDGILGDTAKLSAVIFDSTQTPLIQMNFTAVDSGTSTSNYLFKSLVSPLVLTPGQYTIAGYGWDASNYEHNSNNGGTGPAFNGGGGLISFSKSVWGSGSDTPSTFPMNTYGPAAPDFFDGANMVFEAVPSCNVIPAPGALLLGSLGVSVVGWLRRRRTL